MQNKDFRYVYYTLHIPNKDLNYEIVNMYVCVEHIKNSFDKYVAPYFKLELPKICRHKDIFNTNSDFIYIFSIPQHIQSSKVSDVWRY